jgi:hypothetical protein
MTKTQMIGILVGKTKTRRWSILNLAGLKRGNSKMHHIQSGVGSRLNKLIRQHLYHLKINKVLINQA